MTEAEIRKQVEEEICAWLRAQHDWRLRLHNESVTPEGRDNNLFRAATYGGAADAIERGDYHYPTLDRMKLGPQ